MTHSLRLQFESDQDGHGELFADVEVGDFKGAGSAWFSTTEILELARSLKSTYSAMSYRLQ